ncbi:MAG: acyltransferase [Deltaproteobacteria bacterium]|nr:acyltransferase [Deltaproteobacteria bacterium]
MTHLFRRILDLLAKLLPVNGWRIACQRAKGVRIGQQVYLASDVNIDLLHPELIEIHDHARIGIGVIILAHNRPGDRLLPLLGEQRAPVVIGRDAALYAGAIVLPGVTIGEGAVVGAGAVVETDVPPFSYACGVPAQVVRRFEVS